MAGRMVTMSLRSVLAAAVVLVALVPLFVMAGSPDRRSPSTSGGFPWRSYTNGWSTPSPWKATTSGPPPMAAKSVESLVRSLRQVHYRRGPHRQRGSLRVVGPDGSKWFGGQRRRRLAGGGWTNYNVARAGTSRYHLRAVRAAVDATGPGSVSPLAWPFDGTDWQLVTDAAGNRLPRLPASRARGMAYGSPP